MSPQRLEERLEAASDETANDGTIERDVADAGCALDLLHRRCPDAPDLDLLDWRVWSHAADGRDRSERMHQWNHWFITEVTGVGARGTVDPCRDD